MSDKISENSGIDSWKISPEQLVEAIKLVGDFAKKNPEAAIKLVEASLSSRGRSQEGGSTTPGTTPGSPNDRRPSTVSGGNSASF